MFSRQVLLSGYRTVMGRKPTTVVATSPMEREIEEAVLGALAAAQDKTVDEVRAVLVAAGPGMPLDSLETVEIMLELEERFAVRFPDEPETCAAFQSVRTLVALVRQLAEADAEEGGAG
jgi:acyl carrier protein